ncbi:hypothetical protein QF035_007225 [Streptomyces umbrinus]|uniref:Secreted protein n=1 Tax=Streptomyces umbrinus TaxID=67370 RepID=A0ABU0T1F8_9ACTN|nr:hypothetical protein [Streptomyces umbrinus]MDQ1029643.1 hypothetical protein [Streptomyces umbrinus]
MRARATGIATATAAALAGAIAVGTIIAGPAAESGRPTAGSSSSGPARELTDAERSRVEQAEQRIISRCMAEAGFRYWVLTPLSPEELRAFTHPFVRNDVSWAREHGYGGLIQRKFFAQKKRDPNLAYRNRLSRAERARYLTALNGGPDTPVRAVRLPAGGSIRSAVGGCELEARGELYGDPETYFHADKIATNLAPLYVPKLLRDTRFTTALGAWSDCMRRTTGRVYADPDAIQTDLPKRTKGLSDAEAHAVEVDLAVAESTCAQKSALARTVKELDREYGDPVRGRYSEEIFTSARMRLAALTKANRTVPSSN